LEGVRAGKTFVTTGPLLDFSVNGKDLGSEIVLPEKGEVTIKGEVHFQRDGFDQLMELELVENGIVVRKFPRLDDSGKISFEVHRRIKESSWLALRVNNHFMNRSPSKARYKTAHSAPIYVTLKNEPSIAEHPRTREVAEKWLASLSALELRLAKENIDYLLETEAKFAPPPGALTRQDIMDNHVSLMIEIEYAKNFFEELLSKIPNT
jgi:hypothetical protein